MRISKATPEACAYACRHFHYAHSVPSNSFKYNVWNDQDDWCGVIIFSSGATPNIARPFDLWQGQVLELVRVALNGKQGSGKTSQAVSMALKALHREAPWADIVVSYADVDQNHIGTLYQATNWLYVGKKNEGTRGAFIVFGKKMHPRSIGAKGWRQSLLWLKENVDPNAEEFFTNGKHKYIYPMNKKTRRRVKKLAQEYPKAGA